MTLPAPLITVIVPGRDVESFALQALSSLQSQTEQRWRAVLVDDGSVDATTTIFADAADADPRFNLLRHDVPRGLGAARNAGLDLVDTPLVGFLDGDDEYVPTALARMTATLESTGSDFVVGAYVRTRWNGTGYVPGRVQPWVEASTSPKRLRTTLAEHPDASANIVAWSKVSRIKLWEGLRFPEGVAYEDQMVAQQMYTRAAFFDVIPDTVVHWRLRENGTSITQSRARLSVLRDYLTALLAGISVLRDAGASAAIAARISLILSMDVPPLNEIAQTHPDPAYEAALVSFLAALQELPEFSLAQADLTLHDGLRW